MTVRNLDRMFKPRSVAVIGASPQPATVGSVVVANLRGGGYQGNLSLVNPKYATIDGLPAYANIAALPEAPDLAVIATPRPTVPGLIAELGARGTKAAVVITAGFSGEDGVRLRQAMLDASRQHLLRILGPNCLGLLVPPLGLNASFAHIQPVRGRLAFIAQSGAIITSVIDWTRPRGIGFSHLVSLGDMADVDFGDLLDYFATDPVTDAILLYVEMITHARKFMSAARIAARTKPVIVIKAGRYAESARAVVSHTGAMAGTDLVYDAAFRRAGMLRVLDMEELFAAVETLAVATAPAGDRLTILTNGGGVGILATDALVEAGGRMATLPDSVRARLDRILPPTWSRANPIDIIGDAPPKRYADALAALLQDEGSDAILVLNCPTAIAAGADSAAAVIEALGERRSSVLTCWLGSETASAARRLFNDARLPTYDTPEQAVRAFMHMVNYRRNREQLMETPPSIAAELGCDGSTARATVEHALAEGRQLLSAPEALAVLSAYRLPVNPVATAATPQAAGVIAAQFEGPVALKILSPDITHKSDVGGVALDLLGDAAVTAAASAMLERVRALRPEVRIAGFTLEPMVRWKHAYELIIGMIEDGQFGPVILFGQGGVATELLGDRALTLPPLNMRLARELIERTRVFGLLRGFRDRPPAALDDIALALVRISQMVVDLPEIVELDVNPLLADQQGILAVDARIRVRHAAQPGSGRLAIRPYPRDLEETVRLGDREFLLRPVRPEDEPRFREAFKKLSSQTVRLRFFAPMHELPHALAARLTQIDYEREMAFVLTEPKPAGTADVFAVVRLVADPDNARAEFAIIVRDDVAGQGLGRMLMSRIIEYARARGIGEIFGDVLAENGAMLDLASRLGFRLDVNEPGTGVVRATLRLDDSRIGRPSSIEGS
jgi:acetyltransferase